MFSESPQKFLEFATNGLEVDMKDHSHAVNVTLELGVSRNSIFGWKNVKRATTERNREKPTRIPSGGAAREPAEKTPC